MDKVLNIEERQHKVNKAVRELRRNKLAHGQSFMINSKNLPQGQCYIEYPDGHISLATLNHTKSYFTIVRELSAMEVSNLRNQFELY